MNTNDKLSVVIRHSDRDEIPLGSFGNEVMLNEKGIQRAIEYGVSIRDKKISKIYSSPIGRCVETAQKIVNGYGCQVEIVETKALGAPGLHITDEKIAGEFFLTHGFDEMYDRFIQGKEIPGVPNIVELRQKMDEFIDAHSVAGATTLFITHDMVIAFYHFSLTEKVYTKENWVDYMEGLTFKNGTLHEG